ncbi:MAG: hypothetical protein M3540_12765 [Actinomycetota bacterium]|nr:hypothetical protein [Actinomycetota bacterium]
MRNALRSLRSDERGITLVLVLGTIMILSILVVSVISYASTNSRAASLSSHRQRAYTLAEAGLNDAMSVLYKSSTPAFPGLLPSRTSNYDGGSVTWSGTLDQGSPQTACPGHAACWIITSTGSMWNPTSGSLRQTRKLTLRVPLDPIFEQPLVNDAYDYVFVYGTGAPSGCDFNGANSSVFTSALYVQGNLCLSNSAVVSEETHVWGNVTVSSPQSGIGTASVPNTKGVHVANGCRYSTNGSGSYQSPCTSTDHVWANPVPDTTPISLAPPVIAWTDWYKNASPGPYAGCVTSSGTPNNTSNWATAFDGDQGSTMDITKMNRSVLGTFNLTPASPYSCKNAFGEISWNPTASPPLLTVKGTVFIDGNARIEGGNVALIKYTGVGSLYLTGSFVVKGTKVCAAVSGSDCDWAKPGPGHWDVATSFLDVVAGGIGGGGQSDASDSTISVAFVSAGYQGAVTAANRVDVTSQSSFQGPLVERTLTLGQSLTTYPFGKLAYVPTATPGNPVTAVTVGTPQGFGQ